MSILLERRLVKILNEYNIKSGPFPGIEEFASYVTKLKWPRINYHFKYSSNDFFRMIIITLRDCISDDYKYIHKSDSLLSVTRKGRDFIKIPGGFFEEFKKRRRRGFEFWTGAFIGGTVVSILKWVLQTIK